MRRLPVQTHIVARPLHAAQSRQRAGRLQRLNAVDLVMQPLWCLLPGQGRHRGLPLGLGLQGALVQPRPRVQQRIQRDAHALGGPRHTRQPLLLLLLQPLVDRLGMGHLARHVSQAAQLNDFKDHVVLLSRLLTTVHFVFFVIIFF